MRRFFRRLRGSRAPATIAEKYALHFYETLYGSGRPVSALRESTFDIGIASAGTSLTLLTKRVVLISDTLLLAHRGAGKHRNLGVYQGYEAPAPDLDAAYNQQSVDDYYHSLGNRIHVGMTCPDYAALGQWVLDAEPLLTTGLAVYLPSYSIRGSHVTDKETRDAPTRDDDFLPNLVVRGRQIIEETNTHPLRNALVRPVLDIDLPFIDGIDLHQFGNITREEFDSYTAFRDFLRLRFLELDDAINAVQSQRELVKIGLTIADEVRANRVEMSKATTRRAVMASGALLGSVAATLVAVYGPALQTAIGAIGATGGLWGVIQAMSDNNIRRMRDGTPWHYVWVLSKTAQRP